jgi:hypothetical protein
LVFSQKSLTSLSFYFKQNLIHSSGYYLEDVLQRLPTHPNKRIQELLPHHWQPSQTLQLAA